MNKNSNLLIAVTISLAFSIQVSAKEKGQPKEGKSPRPSFTEIDANADGTIDFDEFSLQEIPFGDYQTVFSDIDTDGDGVLSSQEYNSHKPPRPPKP
jgi:Ca2+-binding EF-hand superfamily protein